ncbi:MAG TPA: LysM peptidoglycan-binding domain-containing protein [Bdellovibrionota bacterium]|nr:LysM peptidoglycan-binding domain-containing protein [Bdellovibrionota bacterium]
MKARANSRIRPEVLALLLIAGWTAFDGLVSSQAFGSTEKPAGMPEKESVELSKILKSIPDAEWKEIAGNRISEEYSIIKGDTLYDISKRLFGDPKYWPKIWALNNNSITNPHMIRPGRLIAFLPGTGSSLPAVAVSDGTEVVPAPPPGSPVESEIRQKRSGRSQEWRILPKQPWELFQIQLPPEVDPQGFDRRNRIVFRTPSEIVLDSIATTERLESLGEINGSRSESLSLSMGDTVYIQSNGQIQVGEVYAITSAPSSLQAEEFSRRGYIYNIVGNVKILGVRDQVFLGTIISARNIVERGNFLIPLPPKIKVPDPIPGPNRIEATLILDSRSSTSTTAQFKFVFIDRGSDDGVQAGMVFRAYEHRDPATDEQVIESETISRGDVIILQSSPRFSTGMILNAIGVLEDRTPVSLLTDVSDVRKKREVLEKSLDDTREQEIDELERIEAGGGLGKKEEKELKQLERWKSEPTDSTAPPTTPDSSLPPPAEGDVAPATPEDGELPPAPEPEALPEPSAESSEDAPPPPPELPEAELGSEPPNEELPGEPDTAPPPPMSME